MAKRAIDIEQWVRRDHYHFFRQLDNPYFSLCAPVDITPLLTLVKREKLSIFRAFLFIVMKAVHAIPEFRLRIENGQVYEYDRVHPGFTVMTEQGVYSNCVAEYSDCFSEFVRRVDCAVAAVRQQPQVGNAEIRHDLIYITCLPWIAFTSLTHPVHYHPADSIPRLSWGQFRSKSGRVTMPLSVQAHHALMDGEPVGRFYQLVAQLCAEPERVISI